MTKLNQILAVEKDAKGQGQGALTKFYQRIQVGSLLSGVARKYEPKDEEGDRLPPENQKVQMRVGDELKDLAQRLTRMYDVVATKEVGNMVAKADIALPGMDRPLIADVPIQTMIFLEKQLVDLITLIKKLPVLDPSETWHYDGTADTYASEPVQTTKTKKIPRNHVLSPATDKHPAQVQMYHEDVMVGTWTTTKYSGALPRAEVVAMLERAEALSAAVKQAREKANTLDIEQIHIGKSVLGYLFDNV